MTLKTLETHARHTPIKEASTLRYVVRGASRGENVCKSFWGWTQGRVARGEDVERMPGAVASGGG